MEHSFNLQISDTGIEVFENLVGGLDFEEGDRSLLSMDFEDPATRLVISNAFDVDGGSYNYTREPIIMGFKEGALDCVMTPDEALSVELINTNTTLELGYLYLNPTSCHMEIIQNNLHVN